MEEYTLMAVKGERCNLADLKEWSTFVVCSWKSQEMINLVEVAYNLKNLAMTSARINNIFIEEVFNHYKYDNFMMVQKIKRDLEDYSRNCGAIKEQLIHFYLGKQAKDPSFSQKSLIAKDTLSPAHQDVLRRMQDYNSEVQKVDMRIVPSDQTATRNLMRLVYNYVQAE